nr:glycosyltransferase family 4 protein [Pseudoruegeria sp. HB172150]
MDRPGGVQRHVRDLSAWLESEGHRTRIIAPPSPGGQTGADGKITSIGHARKLALHGTEFEVSWASRAALRALARELKLWGAELVHMHTPWTPFLTAQMFRALALPAVTTVHATLPESGLNSIADRFIRRSARRLLPQSRAVVIPSGAPLPMLRRLLPGLEPQILPPAIDLSPWVTAGRSPVRRKGLSLVFLGRLEPRKGVDVLLDAWPRIAAALPDAHLTIAGDGPLRPQVDAARSDRLHLVRRPDDAAAQVLLAAADFCLAPAPYGESFGLVLTEAMAAGSLPVAAANPGFASVLTGPGAELLVPPGDAGALARKIITLAAAPETCDSLHRWSRHEAARLDIAHQGPRFLRLYESVLADHPPASSC